MRLARMLPSPLFSATVPARSSAVIEPSPVRASTVSFRGAVTIRLTDGDCQDPMWIRVASLARRGRLDDDAIALLSGVDDQRLRGLRVRPAPLDFDEHFVAVPRLQLNRAVEGAQIQISLTADREALFFPGHDPFAAHVDAAGGRRRWPELKCRAPQAHGVILRMSSSQRP